jgi:hypothetical protein
LLVNQRQNGGSAGIRTLGIGKAGLVDEKAATVEFTMKQRREVAIRLRAKLKQLGTGVRGRLGFMMEKHGGLYP